MEKKTIFALILIFVVFWLSNELIWKKNVPAQTPSNQEREIVTDYPSSEPIKHQSTDDIYSRGIASPSSLFQPNVEIEVNNNILLRNEAIEVSFSNLGGVINGLFLNDYLMPDKVQRVGLIPDNETLLNLSLSAIGETNDLKHQVFYWEEVVVDGYPTVVFFLLKNNDRFLEKVFILADEYHLILEINIMAMGEVQSYQLDFASGIVDTEETVRQRGTDYRFIGQIQNIRHSINLNRIRNGQEITGNIDWAAIRSKYFIKAIHPEQRLQTEKISVFEKNESPAFNLVVRQGRSATDISDRFSLYFGPLLYDNLRDFAPGMEETVELGWKLIRPLGRFFLWLLTTINKAVPNYGFCIIIFAFILKIFLYPLTHKSFQSTHKMQKMNPYMQEIKTKYKSDPKKMQEEMQKLYKEHGVNPVGGCLPLFLQMPIFFALYPVLRYSIELRQASFMFWINDLSEPDSYLILPILMGIFMFIQQKISMPKSIDKAKLDDKQAAAMQSQRMMMYIMPVFMVFIFRTLPSGLVLYWTVFNVFSIIQQYFIVKKINS